MNRIIKRFGHGDIWIYLAVLFLIIFGTVMVGSAAIGNSAVTTVLGQSGGAATIKTLFKQAMFIGVGGVTLFVTIAVYRHRIINQFTVFPVFLMMIGMLVICLAFPAVNGSHAWIPLGIFSFQPSEICKILMVLVLAYEFTEVPSRIMRPKKYYQAVAHQRGERAAMIRYHKDKKRFPVVCIFIPLVMIVAIFGVLVVLQNDTGTALITFLICAACFFMTDHKYYGKYHKILWNLFVVGVIAVFALSIIALICYFAGILEYLETSFNFSFNILQGYQASRFSSWLNPLNDVYNTSAQLVNALIAITKGGIKGVGLFNSTQKFGYIPEVETDFITSLIMEELGLIGLFMIMIPYGIIIFRLLSHGFNTKDSRTRIILVGIASYFFLHLFVNLGGVSGLIPMTGVPLVFISQGGSSFIGGSLAIGIAQATISTDKVRREEERKMKMATR